MTLAVILAAVTLAALAIGLVQFRKSYFTERPMQLWGTDFPDAGSVAHAMAARAQLTAEQLPEGTDWVANFFLAPVWLFWGDLRSGRAETRLARWRLGGLVDGRAVSVQLGPDRVQTRAALKKPSAMWARAHEPIEQQEGLRPFHPVGSPHWVEAVARLKSLFAAGADEVRAEGSALVATSTLSATAPERLPSLLFALEALAKHLEHER